MEGLLRVLLACALPKSSFSQVSAWGKETGLSRMSPAAVFFRLRDSERFLQGCLEKTLSHIATLPARTFGAYHLLALDGTCLSGPGATGMDQRLHVAYDLGSGAPRWVDLTGPEEGEGLARHASRLKKGDLILADRGYGREKGLVAALGSGASLLVRFEFTHLKLFDFTSGERLTPEAAASRIPPRGPADLWVRLPGWDRPLRALGLRTEGGEPIWLLTDLVPEEISPEEARSLYGLRWQVELFFKRMKSLLDLDELPSRDGPSARPWILAKLLLASLAALLGDGRFSPLGDESGKLPLEAMPQGAVELAAGPARRRGQTTKKTAPKQREKTKTIHPLEA